MGFDEYDDRDPKVKDYIEFARAKGKIKSVSDAKRILASAARSIQWMGHTYSGCDWCADCGGGEVHMAEAQEEAKSAIEYILAAGETFTITTTCHCCWHYDATHVRTENNQFGWSVPVCDKCSALDEYKAWKREEIEANLDCGVWHPA